MEQIKKLAEEALALQNKLEMERALKEIVEICEELLKPVKYEHKSLGVIFSNKEEVKQAKKKGD